ncbi:MBL fold metallo-hydrolase [Rhizobium rhizogenes]|jgi:ribonuclease BN (tRNA processing enzyme)|uniref:MBL fold metallo-hydrolase n=1 Tax=Rhizobium rhizogenes TaxID=359 RepID=UPI0022C79D6A|nr:MBL fold metallo-hydrolase [Rhizobium rhizogenes]MCZ7463988.1 MBL fold metallo-hydrolase [Rhizobium rhizogenes]
MALKDRELRVLGSSGGFPIAGFACSGYLVRLSGQTLLLDCGPGVMTALIGAEAKAGIDGVIISHLHSDHVLDLIPLGYALMTEWLTEGRTAPLPLWLPTGGVEFLGTLSDLFGHRHWRFPEDDGTAGQRALGAALARGQDWMLTVFDAREYAPGDEIASRSLKISTAPVDHRTPTAAMRIRTGDADLTYSADTRFFPPLGDFASGTDLFLVDAHLSGPKAPGGAHMTPADAGRLAALAGAKRLVLCHLGAPGDGPSARDAAAAHYSGEIHVAFEMREYFL